MMNSFLLNDFYSITSSQLIEDNKIGFNILLNKTHDIFKGHFENAPVVPGVCQTQIVKELLQIHLQKDLMLHKGDNIKFLSMINPQKVENLSVEIIFKNDNNNIRFEAKLFFETTIFTKFNGSFIDIK